MDEVREQHMFSALSASFIEFSPFSDMVEFEAKQEGQLLGSLLASFVSIILLNVVNSASSPPRRLWSTSASFSQWRGERADEVKSQVMKTSFLLHLDFDTCKSCPTDSLQFCVRVEDYDPWAKKSNREIN